MPHHRDEFLVGQTGWQSRPTLRTQIPGNEGAKRLAAQQVMLGIHLLGLTQEWIATIGPRLDRVTVSAGRQIDQVAAKPDQVMILPMQIQRQGQSCSQS